MIKTFQKDELAIALWVGLNGGHITTDEYIEMMEMQGLIGNPKHFSESTDSSQLDREMALESENIEF
jgi:hypothetical protein